LLGEALAARRREEERREAWERERLAGLREAEPRMRELVELFHSRGYDACPLLESWRRPATSRFGRPKRAPLCSTSIQRSTKPAQLPDPSLKWDHRSTGVAAWALFPITYWAITPDLELWTAVQKREAVKKREVTKHTWSRAESVDPRSLSSRGEDDYHGLNFLLVTTARMVVDGNYPRPELGWFGVFRN